MKCPEDAIRGGDSGTGRSGEPPRTLVLAVDDNADDLFAMRRLLRQGGLDLDLQMAGSAAEALERFAARPAEVVLLDYRLGADTGIDLAIALQDLPGGHDAAMIMLTGQGSESIAVDAMKHGIHDYLVKGQITANGLELAIASALERARTRRELRQKRQDLEASNRELERFSSMVAHDLQSPLTAMELMLRLLQKRAGHEPELQEYADNALRASQGMRELIVELLDYSRAGGGCSSFGTVELGDLEDQVRTSLTAELSADDVALDWSAAGQVHGDRIQLCQLLINLIGNAIKYRPAGRTLEVAVRSQPLTAGGVQLVVRDNGAGMPAAFAARAFEPFARGEHSLPGTGLGLSICRKIAEVHGGDIRLDSQPGRGSTFTLSLPAAPDQPTRNDPTTRSQAR